MGKFWESLKDIGGSAIKGGLTSGLTGAITSLFGDDEKQLEMQKELNEQAARLNYEYGEKAAENAYKRQLAIYERSYQDQSYSAMRKQMEDAGLSVGLMYGGSGSGGGQGEMSGAPQGATGGAQAGKAPTAVERQIANMQMSQLALTMDNLKTDIDVKESQKEKNLADAEAARANAGLTTEKKITEMQSRDPLIEKIKSESKVNWEIIEKTKADRALIDTQNEIKKIELNITSMTEWDQINKIKDECAKVHNDALKSIEELDQAQIETDIKEQTKEAVIKEVNAKAATAFYDSMIKYAQMRMQDKVAEKLNYEAEAMYQHAWGLYMDNNLKNPQAVVEMWYKEHSLELEKAGLSLQERKMFVDAMTQALTTFGSAAIIRGGVKKFAGKKTNQPYQH